jgi:hypothetical protein
MELSAGEVNSMEIPPINSSGAQGSNTTCAGSSLDPQSTGGNSSTNVHYPRNHSGSKHSKRRKALFTKKPKVRKTVGVEQNVNGHQASIQQSDDDSKTHQDIDVQEDKGLKCFWRGPTEADWKTPDSFLNRRVRVWWEGDEQFYEGTVIAHNPDPTGVDDHGYKGPTWSIEYEDGVFVEALQVGCWQDDTTGNGNIIKLFRIV